MRHPKTKAFVAIAFLAVLVSASSSYAATNGGATAPGVTSRTIKIGVLTDATGAFSSTLGDTATGVQGVFNMVNASGGIDGRKLQMVVADDASSPTQALTAAQSLVSQGVFAIISASGINPLPSYRYLHQQNIPVVGACYDGPEWSDPVNSSNMFGWSGCNGKEPVPNTDGLFLKSKGVTKLAVLAYGSIPSGKEAGLERVGAAQSVGIKTVYENFSVVPGQNDFSTEALAIKASGANGVDVTMALSADLALANALTAIGYSPKVMEFGSTGYSAETVSDPLTRAAAQGSYSTDEIQPLETNTAAAKAYKKQLARYAHTTGIPDLGLSSGWVSAQLLVAGLRKVGDKPTRRSYITAMHHLDGFTASGLLPKPINFTTQWGQGATALGVNYCFYVLHLEGSSFIPQNSGHAYCGKYTGQMITPDNPGPKPQLK